MIEQLPHLNALLNTASAALLVCGRVSIRRRRARRHRHLMVAALGTSVLFLVSYLVYHAHHGSTPFPGRGWVRPLYFALLFSHTVLAAGIVPLVGVTVVLALRGRFGRHRRVARWTHPLWLYVNVTGVVIYVVLYRVYGA